MRLLNTEYHKLTFFPDNDDPSSPIAPVYAILSHTWEDDEVLFVDIVGQSQDWK